MKLTLGTAQLGMDYGVVNRSGKPTREQGLAIVRGALAEGITRFDTARAYGDSEEVLGHAFASGLASVQIITKIHLPELSPTTSAETVYAAVDQSVQNSSRALGTSHLEVVLLHKWQHYSAWQGAAWKRLVELQRAGRIASLGASVYDPEEALAALADLRVLHLQIPFNVLDWRWKAACVSRVVKQRSEVTLHARSALLQGILAHPAERWPTVAGFDAKETVERLKHLVQRFGRESITDLCLAYVRSQDWITSVVVGCETCAQLVENLRLFQNGLLTEEQCADLEREIPKAPETLLNPAKWKVASDHMGN